MARLTILLCALTLAVPCAAFAQDNPFGPIPPAPPEQPAPPEEEDTPSTLGEDDEGLSRQQQILIGLAGGVLVFGIAWFILRDARRAAPVEHHLTEQEGGTKSKGSQKPKQQRVQQSRAKAKDARQARKKQKRR